MRHRFATLLCAALAACASAPQLAPAQQPVPVTRADAASFDVHAASTVTLSAPDVALFSAAADVGALVKAQHNTSVGVACATMFRGDATVALTPELAQRDSVASWLLRQVCTGRFAPERAHRMLVPDWRAAYRTMHAESINDHVFGDAWHDNASVRLAVVRQRPGHSVLLIPPNRL